MQFSEGRNGSEMLGDRWRRIHWAVTLQGIAVRAVARDQNFAGDRTNWWIPNRACMEAMLRSAGFAVPERPADEVCLRRVR